LSQIVLRLLFWFLKLLYFVKVQGGDATVQYP